MRSVRKFVVVIGVAVGLTLAFMCAPAAAHDSGHGGGGGGHAGGGHRSQSAHAAGWGGHGGGWGGHGWHHHGYGCCGWGFGFVDPFWYPYPWYPYPWIDYGYDYSYAYVAPPVAPMPPADSSAAPPAAPAPSYWYYCPDSKTYYPYVRQCASAWERVAPTPTR
jgi:hypothetical protein